LDSYHIAKVAEAIGDPSRTLMLTRLMDGRAYTATELSREANVGASTASAHLNRMIDAGLLARLKQGRFVYYRLRDHRVAEAIESLSQLVPPQYKRNHVPGKMRCLISGRSCYDHLAGQLGVALFDGMVNQQIISLQDNSPFLTETGQKKIQLLGLSKDIPSKEQRPLLKACLDWTERRYHLSGLLGKALMLHFFDKRWIVRQNDTRALTLTRLGKRELQTHFNLLDFLPG
jgi:DNA-binding transcriptional ArsR family regulator